MDRAPARLDAEGLMALNTGYLDKLVEVYASGQTSGSYQGRSFNFADGADLRERIREVAAGLSVPDPLGAPASTPRMSIASYRRG